MWTSSKFPSGSRPLSDVDICQERRQGKPMQGNGRNVPQKRHTSKRRVQHGLDDQVTLLQVHQRLIVSEDGGRLDCMLLLHCCCCLLRCYDGGRGGLFLGDQVNLLALWLVSLRISGDRRSGSSGMICKKVTNVPFAMR